MRLEVVTPSEVVLDVAVERIVAQAPDGAFGLLPRHIDMVSELVAGILVYQSGEGPERYLGLDSGTLVKCGDHVIVSTGNAIEGGDLATLKEKVEQTFLQLDEHERVARTALARLEAGMVRRFIDLEKTG